jgi:predicted dehydrogenase
MSGEKRLLRLGIIAAGRLASNRISPALQYVDDLALAAVCDLDETRARRNARRFGGEHR